MVGTLSRAKDTTPLASIPRVLGTRSRLETLQLLMDGPKLSKELPSRIDELHMLREIGVVTCERLSRLEMRWTLISDALPRIAQHLSG
ncbi:hypothetical protein [Flexivirga alba]|uniref:Transcriptional regulator n=1 Tax=Flexivirga alba TaxID=702742 RepID=A0ABW2AJ22_9MICO